MEKFNFKTIIDNLFVDEKLNVEQDFFSDKKLFEPHKKIGLNFKNKFYIENLNEQGYLKNKHLNVNYTELYENLAKSDVGLIFTGSVYPKIGKYNENLSIVETKENIQFYSDLTKKIHMFGSKIFLKLSSNFGRFLTANKFASIFQYSSSFNVSGVNSGLKCARFSDQNCESLASEYGRLSRFAQIVGFDGVLIDASSKDILGEFMSSVFNKRIFGYFSNELDLSKKILNKIQNSTCNFPVIFKINASHLINELFEKNNIKTFSNLNVNADENKLDFLTKLIELGVDGFILEFGTTESEFLENFTPFQKTDLFFNFYLHIKEFFEKEKVLNKFKEQPLLFYHDNLKIGANTNEYSMFDFVDITKQIYSDLKFLTNQKTQNTSNLCIKCNKCSQFSSKFNIIECAINPFLTNNNFVYANIKTKKKVAVVGSGISGLSCAITLAKRGHIVDIFEATNKINPIGKLLDIFGFDLPMKNFYDELLKKVQNFVKSGEITVNFNQKFEAESNLLNEYESIVVATGFKEKFLTISGAVQKHVKSIFDVLKNESIFSNKRNIAILVRSELGLKLALFLCMKNKRVSLIMPDLKFLRELPNSNFRYYFYVLTKFKTKIFPRASVKHIHEDSLEITFNSALKNKDMLSVMFNFKSNSNYKIIPQIKNIDADLFIYEPELFSNNKLYYDIVKSGYSGEVYLVGNALSISDLNDDIKSGFYVGNNI